MQQHHIIITLFVVSTFAVGALFSGLPTIQVCSIVSNQKLDHGMVGSPKNLATV